MGLAECEPIIHLSIPIFGRKGLKNKAELSKKNKGGFEEKLYKGYTFITYKEFIDTSVTFGHGIQALNLCPVIQEFRDYKCQFISVFAPNIQEWYIIDVAT